MSVTIEALTNNNVRHLNKVNGEFVIDSQLVLTAVNTQIQYRIIPHPPKTKWYTATDIDPLSYINDPDKAIYLAFVDNTIAGQIIFYKYWNRYAYIFELIVDVNFRRQGIGRILMDKAKAWAEEKQLAGLMLETQTINVQACMFYEHYGFEIGGFDKFLYKGDDSLSDEIALFWYYHFEEKDGK